MVTAPCPKAKKPKARKKKTQVAITSRSIPTKFDKISQVAWTVRRNPHALNMRKRFKLLTVKKTKLHYWSEKVSEGCRKGVWQRKEDRCVFSEGRYKRGEEAKSSFMPPTPTTPLSHLPPCGIFLHEWLCHTWGTKWSLSLFLCLSLYLPQFFLPLLLYVWCDNSKPSFASCVVLCGKTMLKLKVY